MPRRSRRGGGATQPEQVNLVDLVERLLSLPCTTCQNLGRCYDSAALECGKLTSHLLRDP